MKKLFRWIKEWFVWLTSKRLHNAINDGATYEEACKIVEEEMSK